MSLFCKLQDETNGGHVTVLSGSPERCHVIDNLSARHVARACHLAVVVFLHYEGRRLDVRRRRLRHDLGWRPRRVQLRRLRRRDVGVARHVGDLWHRGRRDGRARLLRPASARRRRHRHVQPGGASNSGGVSMLGSSSSDRSVPGTSAGGVLPHRTPTAARAAAAPTCGRCRQERAAAAAAAPRSRGNGVVLAAIAAKIGRLDAAAMPIAKNHWKVGAA